MPVNRAHIGRAVRSSAPLEITRGDIRRFAAAIGDENPLYLDAEAARAEGYRDVLAPPTFLITVAGSTGPGLLSDLALGLNFSSVVHGQQGFTLHRPVCAGDVLENETRIEDVRDAGRNELISSGTPVPAATSTSSTGTSSSPGRSVCPT